MLVHWRLFGAMEPEPRKVKNGKVNGVYLAIAQWKVEPTEGKNNLKVIEFVASAAKRKDGQWPLSHDLPFFKGEDGGIALQTPS